MRPVNLIPPEDRRGDHAPLRAGIASYVIVGILVVGLIAVTMVVLTNNKISDSEAQLTKLEARQVQSERVAAELAPYASFATLSDTRAATVTSLAQSRFDWARVLNELALVIPRKVSLQGLTGTVSSTAGGSSTTGAAVSADTTIIGPSLQIQGCAKGQIGVARFLASLKDIDGVTRVGMQSSEIGDKTAAAPQDATPGAKPEGCQPGPKVAVFSITVAFDAVPAAPLAAPTTADPAAAVPATTTTPTAPTTPASADPDVAATEAEQQSATDSAAEQTQKARAGAAAVGVDGK